MNLVKHTAWEPLDLLSDLQTDLNRVFNRSLSRNDWSHSFTPVVEVYEETDHYTVHADLPGLRREDFTISVEGSSLSLKGERKEEKTNKDKNYQYSERVYGAFSRTINFPTEVQTDKVSAVYKNGVLDVTLPKAETSKPKQIQVEVR